MFESPNWVYYFAISNLFFIGMYLYQWEKNRNREIRDKILKENLLNVDEKAKSKATQPAGIEINTLHEKQNIPRRRHLSMAEDDSDVIVIEPDKYKELTYNKAG